MIRIDQNRYIGSEYPCFVIAEIGANHNQSLSLSKELIDAAVLAGADAVKFQIYSAETLYSRHTPKHSAYGQDLFTLIKNIETPRQWLPELAAYCEERSIIFFATPFDKTAVDELNEVSPLFKIASFELVDLDLISYTASKGKPIIISTGLATMGEIEDACAACRSEGNEQVVLLQCASLYPAPSSILNLRAMETMSLAFGVPTGLSDHTCGIHISTAAVALGASVIEKHFTLDRTMAGPDHPFAIEPHELKALVKQIREVESAFGNGRKQGPTPEEMEFYDKARRSLHAAVDIPAGTRITLEMLQTKRPGYGIKPKFQEYIIGRIARVDISADSWITWEML